MKLKLNKFAERYSLRDFMENHITNHLHRLRDKLYFAGLLERIDDLKCVIVKRNICYDLYVITDGDEVVTQTWYHTQDIKDATWSWLV